MEELMINKYKAKVLENALRLVANINGCRTKETAFDREVMLATKYIKEVLATAEDGK
jgi:hypothetical protein